MELLQQIKEFLIPELDAIRQEQTAIKERLNAIDLHLVDQSRRIDETNKRIDTVHGDLLGRIDNVHGDLLGRIDKVHGDLLGRIDKVHSDLLGRIDLTNKRIDETNQRIDKVQVDFIARIDKVQADFIARIDRVQADFIVRIDETHRRLDRLFEVIVRRDEHDGLENWMRNWSREVDRRLDALERQAA